MIFDKKIRTDFITTIECRMTSTRLPGKVIKNFGNLTSIELLIKRIKKSKFVNKIILATTKNKSDDILVKIARKNKINFFRGSEEDVLGRLSDVLKKRKEKHVIQLTGDNPFIDPEVINFICEKYLNSKVDFLTNNGFMDMKKHFYPLGMDVSVFKRIDLINIAKKTKNLEDREHPTLFFYRKGKKYFRIKNINILKKWKKNFKPRLTLDTLDDYKLLTKIFNHFNKKSENLYFSLEMIMDYLNNNKKIIYLNKKIKHKIPKGL